MNSIKQLLTLFLFSIITSSLSAQVVGGMNFKLEKIYMAEKYEDVAYKGMNMIENDKYKKDLAKFQKILSDHKTVLPQQQKPENGCTHYLRRVVLPPTYS